jgi:dolichyl-phosphate-mannose-protein mannosyltransferase
LDPDVLFQRRRVLAVAVGVQLTGLRRLALSRWGVTFALTGVAGIALRIWVYRSALGTPNADEAVVGLMARHVLDGELTTFYWGQAYGGSQEALLTAPVFFIAGSSWLALRMIPIALSAVAALLIWRVGRRTIGEPAALAAAAVFWIWPPFVLYQLVHQQGFYASNVVYCGLLLLLALRVVERPDRTRVGLFGLVLGLAFWQTAQIVPVAAGVIGWMIWKHARSLRRLWVAVPFAVLGALPWFIWNAAHGWESLNMPDYGDKTRSLRLLVSPVLPMMVGLRAPFSAELLLPAALTYLIYIGLVAVFVYGAFRTRHRSSSLLYVVPAVFPFVYVISPKTVYSLGTPRFIVVLGPVLALLLAQMATKYVRAAAILALAGVVSVVSLHRMDDWFRGQPPQVTHAKGLGPRHVAQWVPRDLGPLVSVLDTLGLDHVYADYWLAYRLDFDTRERVVAVENRFTGLTFELGQAIPSFQPDVRYRPYDRKVRRARHGFVFYRQTVGSVPIVAQLERHGYRRYVVDSFVVYAPAGVA